MSDSSRPSNTSDYYVAIDSSGSEAGYEDPQRLQAELEARRHAENEEANRVMDSITFKPTIPANFFSPSPPSTESGGEPEEQQQQPQAHEGEGAETGGIVEKVVKGFKWATADLCGLLSSEGGEEPEG